MADAVTEEPFASEDPLVNALANEIEFTYPGSVKGVNVPVVGQDGSLVTDADILTGNEIVQVKSGGGEGLSGQVDATEKSRGW